MKKHAMNRLCTIVLYAFSSKRRLIMKISGFLLLLLTSTTLLLANHSMGQDLDVKVTIELKGEPLSSAFKKIEKQTHFRFGFVSSEISAYKTMYLKSEARTLKHTLELLLANTNLKYVHSGRSILVVKETKDKKTEEKPTSFTAQSTDSIIPIKGRVLNKAGLPLVGATVSIKGEAKSTSTNANGFFELENKKNQITLTASFVGYSIKDVTVHSGTQVTIVLDQNTSELDNVVVIGYGQTTKRFNTGTVSKVTAAEIEKQPVANPLAALAGRASGVVVTQTSGIPGAGFTVQIRGRNSINNTSNPLYIVDGVPFSNNTLDLISNTGPTQQSPFASIPPSSIESIEVLKDADATAIYGSRGANGVILITTKKGKTGTPSVNFNVYTGIGQIARRMPLLNTQQYLAMRKEAFVNDGVTMTPANASDILVWDQNKYTDWQDLLTGGNASQTDATASISGGNQQNQFVASLNYRRETTVFPGNYSDNKGALRVNQSHTSINKRFTMNTTIAYSFDNNLLPINDAARFNIYTPPNAPGPYDSQGNVLWSDPKGGSTYNNPMASSLTSYSGKTAFFQANSSLHYNIYKGIQFLLNLGYSDMRLDQVYIWPKASIDPSLKLESSSKFGNNALRTYIIEPQFHYVLQTTNSKLDAILGTSWQQELNQGNLINATGYSSEALLGTPSGASNITTTGNYTQYRYNAAFGRINYQLKQRYIINLSGRRDGSSRFGPGNQFANFGAVGVGWIFSEESFLKNCTSWLPFGKLKASYGSSGNDQIGDYAYLNTWNATPSNYQSTGGLIPGNLYNPDYAWEVNKKLEASIEFGFLQNRLLFTTNYFRNRSGNQLIDYTLPAQAGRSKVTRNLGALVENTGWEWEISGDPIQTANWHWQISMNLTLPRNKLLAYPDLESSSDASKYVVGHPLDIKKLFVYEDVDQQTGLYKFKGTIRPKDQTAIINLTTKYYGGISNTVTYKDVELSFHVQVVNQMGEDYMTTLSSYVPGTMNNQPTYVLDRWRKTGDQTDVQRFTLITARTPYSNFISSNGAYKNASFLRFKNLTVGYNVPSSLVNKVHLERARLYVLGQNLFTITKYRGIDPENRNLGLAPLRILTAGLQVTF